ncbi:hypothetical protein [Pseudomonas sp.]|uniref:hypothetical protein n=1 Tax=Pseudomonas sp. TaxID=306 RepID=UPI00289DCB05|nr:hypothetical protein [Pseudomonas sp.]
MVPVVLDPTRAEVYHTQASIVLRIPIGVALKPFAAECLGQGGLFDAPAGIAGYEWPVGSGQKLSVAELANRNPLGPVGTKVALNKIGPYQKTEGLAPAVVASARIGTIDGMEDGEWVHEGYSTWTEYALHWNQRYPTSPWDLDPVSWVIKLVRL